jgi:hypothetical protein
MIFDPSRRWAYGRRLAALIASSCMMAGVLSGTSPAGSTAVAATTIASPSALISAGARSRRADHALVHSATRLETCLRAGGGHGVRCASVRRALQHAGSVLAVAERSLATIASTRGQGRGAATSARLRDARVAPRLTASGYTLRWAPMGRIKSYVLQRDVPRQDAQYSVVDGTSVTPPAVPGVAVSYSLRTTAHQSSWSHELRVSYPAPETSHAQVAPVLYVTGQTLSWRPIAGVSSYVLATKAPSGMVHYTVVSGTSVTPESIPGAAVQYSVRTPVDGSVWAQEVTVTYPIGLRKTGGEAPVFRAANGESSTSTAGGASPLGVGAEVPAPGTGSGEPSTPTSDFSQPFVKGVAEDPTGWGEVGAEQIGEEMHSLGANWVRVDLPWKEVMPSPGVYDWSHFDQVIRTSAALGLHVLPILDYAPSWTTPTNAAGYAEFAAAAVARYGPGTPANLPWFELWNEPYFSYAWSGKTPEPTAYARDVLAASEATKRVAPSVKLLVAAEYTDSGQTGGSSQWETTWVKDMFTAVPNLGKWINGVAVHPYGDDPSLPVADSGGWKDANGGWSFQRIDAIREQFLAYGVNVPFWITEVGWSTSNMSEAEQDRDYVDLATQVQARPWVRALFAYTLREYQEHPVNDESGMGLLKYGTWQPKAAFYGLQQGFAKLG